MSPASSLTTLSRVKTVAAAGFNSYQLKISIVLGVAEPQQNIGRRTVSILSF